MNMQVRGLGIGYNGTKILRARGDDGLSLDAIQAQAPSVFAADKHASRSARYTFIPTKDLLTGLLAEGFVVHEVRQAAVRDVTKDGFQKHSLRLRHRSNPTRSGGAAHEVLLANAHDGAGAYIMMSGWFRFACLNGLIVCDGADAEVIRFRHSGGQRTLDNVVDAAFTVIDGGTEEARRIEHMQAVPLNLDEQVAFAEAAMELRFDGEATARQAIDPRLVNTARRPEDQRGDVWTTFNRVQENLVQGGLQFRRRQAVANGDVREVRATTRPLQNIEGDTKLNRALWVLAERMAQLKAAA